MWKEYIDLHKMIQLKSIREHLLPKEIIEKFI